MIDDEELIQTSFNRFFIDDVPFSVDTQQMVLKTKDYVAFVSRLDKSTKKSSDILLYVYNQSWGQIPFVLNNYQKFATINQCSHIIKHYAIGIVNNMVGLATQYHEGISIMSALEQDNITPQNFLLFLQSYLQGIEYLYSKDIRHDNINPHNLLLVKQNFENEQFEYIPQLGTLKIIVERKNRFMIKENDFQQFGWALIQIFCKLSCEEIIELKKQHKRKFYHNQDIPDNVVKVINSFIEFQFTSEQSVNQQRYETSSNLFKELCNTDCMLEFAKKVISKYKDQINIIEINSGNGKNNDDKGELVLETKEVKQICSNTHKSWPERQQSYLLSCRFYKQEKLLSAEVFEQERKYKEANDIYKELIMLSKSQDSTPLYYLSYSLIEQGSKSEEIIENLIKAIQINQKHSQMYHCLGLQYFNRDNIIKSIQYIQKSLSLNSLNADCYHTYGKILSNNGNYSESKKALIKSLKINPSYGGYFDLGNNYFIEKNYKKSIKCFKNDLYVNKTSIAYQYLGKIYEIIGNYQKSIYYYNKYKKISRSTRNTNFYQEEFVTQRLENLKQKLSLQLLNSQIT